MSMPHIPADPVLIGRIIDVGLCLAVLRRGVIPEDLLAVRRRVAAGALAELRERRRDPTGGPAQLEEARAD